MNKEKKTKEQKNKIDRDSSGEEKKVPLEKRFPQEERNRNEKMERDIEQPSSERNFREPNQNPSSIERETPQDRSM